MVGKEKIAEEKPVSRIDLSTLLNNIIREELVEIL